MVPRLAYRSIRLELALVRWLCIGELLIGLLGRRVFYEVATRAPRKSA